MIREHSLNISIIISKIISSSPFSIFKHTSEGRILTISQVQKLVLRYILLIDLFQSLFRMKQSISSEEVDGFGVVQLEFVLDDHDELEYCEFPENENS